MHNRISLAIALAVLMTAAVQFPGTARADDAETLLQEGVVYMRVGKFHEALKAFGQAQKKAKDNTTRARILVHTGVAHGVMGKKDVAEKSFREALLLDASVAPVAGETKRAIIELFNKVRAGLTGEVSIKADREGALILVDGKEAGKAPASLKLPVGKHALAVRGPHGLYLFEQEVVARHDDTVYVKAALKFVGGKLTITSRPAGAAVTVDGEARGKTPLKDLELSAGEHTVVLAQKGYQEYSRQLNLKAGSGSTVDVALVKGAMAAAAKPGETPVEPPAQKKDAGFKWPVWTTVAAAGALAAAGAGLGLGLAAKSAYDEYETTPDRARYDELRDQIPGLELGANVAFGLAGGLAATAVLLYFLVDRPAAQESAPAVSVSPSGASFKVNF